jgi:hypothetical protein
VLGITQGLYHEDHRFARAGVTYDVEMSLSSAEYLTLLAKNPHFTNNRVVGCWRIAWLHPAKLEARAVCPQLQLFHTF